MSLPTKPSNYNEPQERERLLATYAGIFPKNIKEFGEQMAKRIHKPRTNYSK